LPLKRKPLGGLTTVPRYLLAQWAGGYSGNTHTSRVKDTEATLRLAIAALRSAVSENSASIKAKAVRQIARKLLVARVRMMKARMAALPAGKLPSHKRLALQKQLILAQEHGVAGILKEFRAVDAVDSEHQS
jgi:hypothetical protein